MLAPEHPSNRSYKSPQKSVGCKEVGAIEGAIEIILLPS